MRGTKFRYSAALAKPELRKKLAPRRGAYPHPLREYWTLGYYKPLQSSGMWTAAVRFSRGRRKQHIIAIADDEQPADSVDVLTFKQALVVAAEWCEKTEKFGLSAPDCSRGPRTEMIICPCGPVYTVGHALGEYLAWTRKHGMRSSFESALSLINRFIIPSMATVPVEELMPDHFYDLMYMIECTPKNTLLRRKQRLIDPDTLDPEARRQRRHSANNTLAIVRAALNRAWENGKASNDRAWRCVRSYKGTQKPRTDILTRKECTLLLRQCKPDLRQLVLAALYTGCRITELLNMRADDLCRERMAVYVRPLKTYRSRYVTLPEEGYVFFKSLIAGKGRNSRLFFRADGKPWTRETHCFELHLAMERAGLPKTFVFHSLRHTYASLRLQEGVAPIAVSRQLGHKNMRTVMEIYAHCADDFVDREIRKRFLPIIGTDPVLAALTAPNTSVSIQPGARSASRQTASPWRKA